MIDHKKSYINSEVEYFLPIRNSYYNYVHLTGIICKIYNKYSEIKILNVIHDGSNVKYYKWCYKHNILIICSNIYLSLKE